MSDLLAQLPDYLRDEVSLRFEQFYNQNNTSGSSGTIGRRILS